jgi:hypothetical protein
MTAVASVYRAYPRHSACRLIRSQTANIAPKMRGTVTRTRIPCSWPRKVVAPKQPTLQRA